MSACLGASRESSLQLVNQDPLGRLLQRLHVRGVRFLKQRERELTTLSIVRQHWPTPTCDEGGDAVLRCYPGDATRPGAAAHVLATVCYPSMVGAPSRGSGDGNRTARLAIVLRIDPRTYRTHAAKSTTAASAAATTASRTDSTSANIGTPARTPATSDTVVTTMPAVVVIQRTRFVRRWISEPP